MAININIQTAHQLEQLITNRIRTIMKNKVANRIKSELIKEYKEQVYSYIGTQQYIRRKSLLDKNTYRQEEKTIGDVVTLIIDNIAHPSPSLISSTKYPIDDNAFISDWIENGEIVNPWNTKHYSWTDKREVFKNVENKLKTEGVIEDIIKRELIKTGFVDGVK